MTVDHPTLTPDQQLEYERLSDAIETTMKAAHRACQPMFMRIAQLSFPASVLRLPAVTETFVSSTPIGANARVFRAGYTIQPG